MGYREVIAKVIVETLAFTKPFIHFDRLAELGLVDVTNNGGSWRPTFEKNYRFTVVYTTKRKPLHRNTIQEDESRFENVKSSFIHLNKPSNGGEVLGLFIWGRTSSNSRYIPEWIRERICCEGARCLICDEDRDIECDHVNDDYEIPLDQLKVSDFQPLCQSCNKTKREAHKRGIKYYRDIRDPGKSVIRLLFGLPSDFVFPLLAEERFSNVRFYRNPQLVREMHINHLRRIIYCQ
jgi:5-methylcytosine-specific restriction endonuclease McrA